MWLSTAEKVCNSSYDERCCAASGAAAPSAVRRTETTRAFERMVDSSVKRGEPLACVSDELGEARGRQRHGISERHPPCLGPVERELGQAQHVGKTRVAGIDGAALGERRLRFGQSATPIQGEAQVEPEAAVVRRDVDRIGSLRGGST